MDGEFSPWRRAAVRSYGDGMLGGNPADLSALAQRLTAASESVGAIAGASTSASVWQGKAAAAHADRLGVMVHDLLALRDDVDTAAGSVSHLASVVAERQQFLLNAWNAAREAAEHAVDATVDGVQRTWEYAEDAGGWVADKLEDVKFW